MFIDLSEVIKNEGEVLKFSDEIKPEGLESLREFVKFSEPLQVSGEAVNVGSVIELRASVVGRFTADCGRCGKETVHSLNLPVSETLIKEDGDIDITDEDVVVFSGHGIELDEIIENNIFLSLPIRFLCSEDCKGLCPKCGKDLNEGECNCDDDDIDPRFAALRDLIK